MPARKDDQHQRASVPFRLRPQLVKVANALQDCVIQCAPARWRALYNCVLQLRCVRRELVSHDNRVTELDNFDEIAGAKCASEIQMCLTMRGPSGF